MDGQMGSYEPLQVNETELYDLEKDPGESINVATDFPEIISTIEALADEMRMDLGDSLQGIEGSGRRPAGSIN